MRRDGAPLKSKRCPPGAGRRGWMLVEVVAVLGASAALTGAAIAGLMAMQRADRSLAERRDRQAVMGQLAERIRSDVHAASSLSWDGEGQVLRLTLADGDTIEYRAAAGRWERRLTDAKPAATADLRQAAGGASAMVFRALPGAEWSVAPGEASAGEVVRIAWSADTDWEVHVTVGRDTRLLHE